MQPEFSETSTSEKLCEWKLKLRKEVYLQNKVRITQHEETRRKEGRKTRWGKESSFINLRLKQEEFND